MIKMELSEVLNRLENNGVLTQLTMLNGDFNQIICSDNPSIPPSTWFLISDDETVDVDEDFADWYPL